MTTYCGYVFNKTRFGTWSDRIWKGCGRIHKIRS